VARALAVFALLLVLGQLAGCDRPRYWLCEEVVGARLHALPKRLSQTGLFAEGGTETLAQGVRTYTPRFALWSDGAEKRRWFRLPSGTRIDTHDMDAWLFPEGTQFWKEFTRDGVRVETRLLQKIGPADGDWVGMAYLWDDAQHDAYAVPYGAIDALGTPHNVPAASECMACHGGTKSRVLGFSAIQLGSDSSASGLVLSDLVEAELLTQEPDDLELVVPGTSTEQTALGYLHANCSSCHNQARPSHDGARCFEPDNALDFRLNVAELREPADTATYRTMGKVVRRGHPGESRLIELVSHRGMFKQMPPLASERVDEDGVALLRAWIGAL
jgi:hypothetical protein